MARNKSAWDHLQNLTPSQTTQYRDVYNDQQLERTTLGNVKDMKSRVVSDIAMTVAFFVIVWLILSLLSYLGMLMTAPSNSTATDFFDSTGVLRDFSTHCQFTWRKFFIDVVLSSAFFGIMYIILKRSLQVQNEDELVADINNWPNDQHIAIPEELHRKFDWFPDVGATSDVQFSSLISHMALSNKGLKKIKVSRRADKDVVDENGEVVLHKGEILRDEDGNVLFDEKPMIDEQFMHELYEVSGVPNRRNEKGEPLRKFWDTTQIPYNPDGKNRDKLGKYKTVADLINADWQLPEYEPQPPSGAYLVDTAPVNTMCFSQNI